MMRAYEAPETVEALLAALSAQPDAMILAGGHSLLPAMINRKQRSGHLIDIGRVAALKEIGCDAGGATVGAAVTLSQLLASPVAVAFPTLARAVGFVGNPVVRNRATVGGSLAWSDPRGEVLLMMIALDATIVTDRRMLAAEALVSGPFRNVLEPGELIIEVRIPPSPAIAFDEIMTRNSTGKAILSAACRLLPEGRVRLSLGGLVDRPVRSAPLVVADETALTQEAVLFVEEALETFAPLPDPLHSIDYRRTVAPRLLRRCFTQVRTL